MDINGIFESHKRKMGYHSIYEFITSPDDLKNALYKNYANEHYKLRKEVKRDRFIYNSSGIEKELERDLNAALTDVRENLNELANETVDDIIFSLNNLSNVGGKVTAPHIKEHKFAENLGRAVGKALVNTAENIYDDMTKEK